MSENKSDLKAPVMLDISLDANRPKPQEAPATTTTIEEKTVPEAWRRVEAARNPARPTARQIISRMIDGFIELKGDRRYADDPAIVGGIGWLGGMAVTVIGEDKGATTQEKVRANFGMPHPEGYRKALRLMRQAEKFKRPVLCLVDTSGAYCGIGAEERGQGQAIAESLMAMSRLKTPVISIVLGEGGSGGALALAVADRVAMLENAIYSILSPEGFASILWKDGSRAQEAAGLMRLTAAEVRALGVIEDVIQEPGGDAQGKPDEMAAILKDYAKRQFDALCGVSVDELVENRYQRFRGMNWME